MPGDNVPQCILRRGKLSNGTKSHGSDFVKVGGVWYCFPDREKLDDVLDMLRSRCIGFDGPYKINHMRVLDVVIWMPGLELVSRIKKFDEVNGKVF